MLKTCTIILSFLISSGVLAQGISDAFRYLQPLKGGGINGIAMGFSNSTFGTDASALFSNPASLGFLKTNQFSIGFGINSFSTESELNQSGELNNYSNTGLDHFAILTPIPVSQGSLVLGFGYTTINAFDELSTGRGFNSVSSYAEGISGYDPGARPLIGSADISNRINSSLYFEFGYEAFLIDTVRLGDGSFRYRTPVFGGNVDQEYSNLNEGTMDTWIGAFSFEAVKDIFIGGSVNLIVGYSNNSYKWTENAAGNFYSSNPDSGISTGADKFTFNRLEMTETVEDEIVGYSFKIGAVVRFNEANRLGLSVSLPRSLTITSKYSYDLIGYFRNVQSGTISSFGHPAGKYSDKVSYDLTGPAVIDVNYGFISFPFQVEFGLTTMNWSNTKFESNDDLIDFEETNETIKFKTKRVYQYKAGAQYALPELSSIIRAGIIANEILNQKLKSDMNFTYSFGLEFVPSTDYRINIAYAFNNQSTTYNAYTPASATGKAPVNYVEEVSNHNIILGTTFNF